MRIRTLLSRAALYSRRASALGRSAGETTASLLARLAADPTLPMRAIGLTPDPWQAELILAPERQVAALCTRRSGKTQAVAARVTARSLTTPGRKTLIFSPTEDQSKELLGYVREMNDALGCPVEVSSETESRIRWVNGSEVKAKTDRPKSSRGFTPHEVVIDEAAQVSDLLYLSVAPMQALGKCDVLALTTPFGKMGWFYELWNTPAKSRHWRTFRVTADQCPRIDRATLEMHRAVLPPQWFDQEYNCVFNNTTGVVFDRETLEACVTADDLYAPLDIGAR
jgi:hypothetical protein